MCPSPVVAPRGSDRHVRHRPLPTGYPDADGRRSAPGPETSGGPPWPTAMLMRRAAWPRARQVRPLALAECAGRGRATRACRPSRRPRSPARRLAMLRPAAPGRTPRGRARARRRRAAVAADPRPRRHRRACRRRARPRRAGCLDSAESDRPSWWRMKANSTQSAAASNATIEPRDMRSGDFGGR